MSTTLIPEWLQESDADFASDLQAIGIDLSTPEAIDGAEQHQRDAIAGMLLRRMARLAQEKAALLAMFDAEVAALRARIERRVAPIETRLVEAEAQVKLLAERSSYGKKQSHETGFGTYGRRKAGSKLEILDQTVLTVWCEDHHPNLVRVTLQLPLSEAREYLTDEEILEREKKREVLLTQVKEAGLTPDVAPGIHVLPERFEYFAKPDPSTGEA